MLVSHVIGRVGALASPPCGPVRAMVWARALDAVELAPRASPALAPRECVIVGVIVIVVQSTERSSV